MRLNRIIILSLIVVSCAIAARADDALPLSIHTAEYPHIESIRNGSIKIPECRISYTTMTYQALVRRFDQGSAGDVIEVDIASYLKRFSTEEKHDWILVPVFPWREFPHHHLLTNSLSPVSALSDLNGKTIGPDHLNKSIELWSRGIIQSSDVVKPESLTWNPDISHSTAPHRALFADPTMAEKEYFKETRIFPIITVLAVRVELVHANPWLPEALFIAYSEAKAEALKAGSIPLPWGENQRAETLELMKKNYWSYGVKNNPKSLGALFKYAHDLGIITKELSPDDVFASETLQLIDEKGAKN